jgi:hypothetical protein
VTQTVVVTDNQKPVITTNGDKNVNNDANVCGATVTVSASATDNCSVGTVTGVRSDALALNAVYPVGTTTIKWNVTDVNGNPANEVTQTVVVTDNQKPTVHTNNITIQLDANGAAGITLAQINNVSTDNCSISSYSLSKTSFDCTNVGANAITLTVTDVNGNSNIGTATVTVQDIIKPSITCPSPAAVNYSTILCGATVSGTNASFSDNCSGATIAYTLSGATTGSGTGQVPAAQVFALGTTVVTYKVTDPSNNSVSCSFNVLVNPGITTTSITVAPVAPGGTTASGATPASQQYSDRVTLTAKIVNGYNTCGGPNAAASVTFNIGTQIMGTATLQQDGNTNNLIATLTVPLLEATAAGIVMDPNANNKSVTATFNSVNTTYYTVSNASGALTINKEDARADYTGVLFASTSSASSNTATVLLAASIRDISVTTDASGDTYSGDIRKALVRFINRDNNTPISGWLPVSLVSATDLTTGTIAYSWQNVSIGTLDAAQFTVGIEVGGPGYYVRNSSIEDAVITIAKPLGDFVSGGGYNKPSASAGTYKSDLNARMNFGLNVKYNKTNKNVQGSINFIFRRTIAGVIHTYQIKGNAMTSLSTNTTNPLAKTAVFTGKANLTDITNPLLTVSIGGGYLLQVTMTDRGEPGTNDAIGVTLYDNSTLLYSNNWISGKTAELTLIGGNLNITNSSVAAAKIIATEQPVTIQGKVVVSPNPANQYVNLQLTDEFKNRNVDLQLFDNSGSLVKHWLDHFAGKGQLIKLTVAELTNGLYTLVVKDNKGKLLTFKIVVQH